MSLSELFGHSVVGGIIILFGFFGWLFKQSVYGELEVIKKGMKDLETNVTHTAEKALFQAARDVDEAKTLAADGISEIKDSMRIEIEKIKSTYVPIMVCNAERDGCQAKLLVEISAVKAILGEKMDLIIRRQVEVIGRMDHHINGSHKE